MRNLPFSFYLKIALCALLWGSAFPVIKLSYGALQIDGLGDRLLFAGSRFILAGLFLLPFCRRSVLQSAREIPKGLLLWVTLGQTFFQYLFFYYALEVSSGTLGALLVASGSFWWVLLAPLFGLAPFPDKRQWIILAVCTVGIVLAVYAPGAGSGQVLLGAVCFLGANLSGALGMIGLKKVSHRFGTRSVTAISLFAGGWMLFLLGGFALPGYIRDFNWTTLGVTVYLGFLSACAFAVWNHLIERFSVKLLSTYRFLIPFCGVLQSVLLIPGETLGAGVVIGGILILGGLILLSRTPESRCPTVPGRP